MMEYESSSTFLLTILLICMTLVQWIRSIRTKRNKKYPPGPTSKLPIIGHLHHMRHYEKDPWEGFTELSRQLGDIYFMQMGSRKMIVVSSLKAIREVLVEKGQHFADRPNFKRYDTIFDGDRENALALCDWSRTQRMRRIVATLVILPRFSTHLFHKLNQCIKLDMRTFLRFKRQEAPQEEQFVLSKPDILFLCGNIFSNYLCSQRFEYGDEGFASVVYGYDYIFYDVNQSYVFDLIPWITRFGFASSYFKELSDVCLSVRHHMENKVITPRLHRYMAEHGLDKESKEAERKKFVPSRDPVTRDDESATIEFGIRSELKDLRGRDFLDVSLEHHFKEPTLYPWHVAVFEVLDLIGGSSAVGNLLMRLLGHLTLHSEFQELIFKESVRAVRRQKWMKNVARMEQSESKKNEAEEEEEEECDEDDEGIPIVNLSHRRDMPLMDACIRETLRLGSSPIVPHVATRDTKLFDYDVDEGTIILFNTYKLNMSQDNWKDPYVFNPRRFLIRSDQPVQHSETSSDNNNNDSHLYLSDEDDGSIKWTVMKPKHFMPFSVGRRACLGYKLTKTCTFATVANLCLRYHMEPESPEAEKMMREQLRVRGGLDLPADLKGDKCFKIKMTPRSSDQIQKLLV